MSALNAHLVYENHFRRALAFGGPRQSPTFCLMGKTAPAREFWVITRVLLGLYYSVLGGCQGIVRWLLGCCWVVARVLQGYSG